MCNVSVVCVTCLLRPRRPANFDVVEGPKEQQAMAARMTSVLERQVRHRFRV
jgi:hypothetical protein